MNAQAEFEHSLAAMLDYGRVKLSIVKGDDKQYHLKAESWIFPEPVYLDNFLNIDYSKNTFWDKHATPIASKK